jgi:N-acetylmuramoyl-L-alanine amidase
MATDNNIIKTWLDVLGYNPGLPGFPAFKKAIMAFQHDRGLKEDGIVGPKTTEAMRLAIKSASSKQGPIFGELATRNINEIIIHCTATPEGKDFTVADIRQWHINKGWADIGYHFVVYRDGTIHAGRPEKLVGAHVEGHNKNTLGVVYVGGVTDKFVPKDTRTPQQTQSLLTICKALLARYPKITKISGHNEYSTKACPSFDVQKDALGALVKR